ncbi:hypothetical protein BYT27DRAFT_7101863 [Phlegmacium glaucopus]|nr:hypothetical protein BYT27DRAFT_7101863 [Phlegmacium glaucopus]
MSARRQSSTTSLSKYARINSPVLQNRSLDFCNSFWGIGDGGVDVLFARMRGAARTMEELKTFWKERAAIEEEYAKRLAKLAKMTLGRDEIGDLRNSCDTIRIETERQAGFHHTLSQQLRSDLEIPTSTFHARQLHHKKTYQTAIEKEFKTKQTQESYVNKAREKYEQDCVRINSFTAQASLVQGKDLEKINLKLERTQQTVQTNEREFSNFAKALAETVQKWEHDWKTFCDSCQDLEENRMEFMKDNMWTYANAISTVCVSDDESCEKVRLALEQMELEKEMEGFVRDYGTGNQIPDPPAFVNYQIPDAIPSSSARPTTRPAQFIRSSSREIPVRQNSTQPDDEPVINTAGVGAGGGSRRRDSYNHESADLSRQVAPSGAGSSSQHQPQQVPYTNGASHHHSKSNVSPSPPTAASQNVLQRRFTASVQSAQLQRVLQDPHAETIDPTAETYIKVGSNAYKVDLSKDPQQQAASVRNNVAPPTRQNNGTVDPLMKQLEELQNTVSSTGSGRRNTLISMNTKPAAAPEQKPGHVSLSASGRFGAGSLTGSSSLAPIGAVTPSLPGSGPQQNRTPTPVRDYRNSAEVVVGTHPSVSRPPSPNPPTAAFMVPKPSIPPSGSEVVTEVLADYQQSLPGERKSISHDNSNSRAHTPSSSQAQNHQGQNLARPPSQLGHAGIGAHGSRSNSPQPISRVPSPAPSPARNNFMQPPLSSGGQGVVRAPSPNTVGIALDPSGRVLHDEMAQRYQQLQQHVPHQQPLQRPPPPPQTQHPAYNPPPLTQQQQMQQQQPQRRTSFVGAPPAMAPPVAPVPYAVTPPPNMYHTPSPQPSYVQPPPPMQPVYNPPPVQYQPPQQQQQQQQPRYQQQQQPPLQSQPAYNNVNLQRTPSLVHYNGPPPPQQQVQQVQQPQQMLAVQQGQRVTNVQTQTQQARGYQQHPQQPQYTYQDPASTQRSPSPVPPPQAADDGNRILFYVKALYDYSATIEEEFDFQAGDIIAVTATPDDGWWSGELLDENRRQKGRNVFPSNFVCLF